MGRVAWVELPREIREWVEKSLGSRVVGARSQAGGFSPGAACRLRLADGGRAFVKAVSAAANPQSPVMHRREAVIAAVFPRKFPRRCFSASMTRTVGWRCCSPMSRGGRQAEPWDRAELEQVLAAVSRLHDLLTPSPLVATPTIAEHFATDLIGWRTLAEEPPASSAALDPWCRRHLDELAELESAWADAAAGATLLHNDLRSDNMLITRDGVVFVDWPHASVGAPFFDLVAFAPSVAMQGGPDPEWLVERRLPQRTSIQERWRQWWRPSPAISRTRRHCRFPPGLPTIRTFQEAQAIPARAWLRRLTGWT